MVGDLEADLTSYCWSRYRAERTEGADAWRITAMTSVYEHGCLTVSVPGTKLAPAVFAACRPSYRCLAWYFPQTGSDVRPDLPGDDQPEAVARHDQAQDAWLHDTTRTTEP